MGCNISTFIDTLIAGLLLSNPEATNLVLIQIISVLIVSFIILILFFRRFQNFALHATIWLNGNKTRMLIFLLVLFLVPLLLVFM